MKRLIVNCDFCGKSLEKLPRDKRYKTHFCDKICKGNWSKTQKLSLETKAKISKATSGKNNGMYNKTHSIETKEKMADAALQRYIKNPELKYICGNSRLTPEERSDLAKNTHKYRTHESYVHSHNEESKKKIGIKSKEKFTPEYKLRVRKSQEEKELIIPLDKREEYDLYKMFSNWIEKMFNKITDEKQLELLQTLGVFNNKINKKGIIRDHKYSRYSGWVNGVFPEILRHPCNCQIITHSDNLKKKKTRYIDGDVILLNELFISIQNYKNDWQEQNICLQLINEFNDGKRYDKIKYIKEFYEYEKHTKRYN